jgi:hypothetical protein
MKNLLIGIGSLLATVLMFDVEPAKTNGFVIGAQIAFAVVLTLATCFVTDLLSGEAVY